MAVENEVWQAGTGGGLVGAQGQSVLTGGEIGIIIKGQVIVISRIEDFTKEMLDGLREIVWDISDKIEGRARIMAPFATGRLRLCGGF